MVTKCFGEFMVRLTEREVEVLKLVALGNRIVNHALIPEETVKAILDKRTSLSF